MNTFHKSISTIAVAAVMALAGSAMAENEAPTETSKPLALRRVMDELGRDMQAVMGAISKEDWALVATLAPKIASHAEPPLPEKLRILAWLGGETGKFRGFDRQAHEAATAMGEAAKRSDGQAVIAAFAKVQQSCLDCHQNFRQAFVEHFYGRR